MKYQQGNNAHHRLIFLPLVLRAVPRAPGLSTAYTDYGRYKDLCIIIVLSLLVPRFAYFPLTPNSTPMAHSRSSTRRHTESISCQSGMSKHGLKSPLRTFQGWYLDYHCGSLRCTMSGEIASNVVGMPHRKQMSYFVEVSLVWKKSTCRAHQTQCEGS